MNPAVSDKALSMEYTVQQAEDFRVSHVLNQVLAGIASNTPDMVIVTGDGEIQTQKMLFSLYSKSFAELFANQPTSLEPVTIFLPGTTAIVTLLIEILTKGKAFSGDKEELLDAGRLGRLLGIQLRDLQMGSKLKENKIMSRIKTIVPDLGNSPKETDRIKSEVENDILKDGKPGDEEEKYEICDDNENDSYEMSEKFDNNMFEKNEDEMDEFNYVKVKNEDEYTEQDNSVIKSESRKNISKPTEEYKERARKRIAMKRALMSESEKAAERIRSKENAARRRANMSQTEKESEKLKARIRARNARAAFLTEEKKAEIEGNQIKARIRRKTRSKSNKKMDENGLFLALD